MRTQDIGGVTPQETTANLPRTGGFPVGPVTPGPVTPQPQPVVAPVAYPQTSGFPATAGFPQSGAFPQSGPQPVGQFPPPGGPGPAGKGGKRALFVSLAAVVVVGLLVAGYFVIKPSGSDLPTADSCKTIGATDGKGFTDCMKQLAGSIADNDACQPAISDSGPAVRCPLPDGYQVTYVQYKSSSDLDNYLKTQAFSGADGDLIEAEWKGNGLDGRYEAGTIDENGRLVFSVADRPLLGQLTKGGVQPNDLADYFEQKVEPGS